LPKRLIEISYDRDGEYWLKLVESGSLPAISYVALSYSGAATNHSKPLMLCCLLE
jgi:hypothetical protein